MKRKTSGRLPRGGGRARSDAGQGRKCLGLRFPPEVRKGQGTILQRVSAEPRPC